MVQLNNVFFSYPGAASSVLKGIDLSVRKGDYLSVVGDNGSGKSTLMRLILGFLKPVAGDVKVDTNRIGYVPQKTDFGHTDFPITVYEVLNSYRKLLKIRDKQVIDKALSQIGMLEYASCLIGSLSGGQHQKIMIARALMGIPDLLILDEPSSGVDVHSQGEIYALLKQLNREKGMTILSVEHNLEAAISNSTAIYHLSQGVGHICSPEQYASELLLRKAL